MRANRRHLMFLDKYEAIYFLCSCLPVRHHELIWIFWIFDLLLTHKI